MNVNNSQVISAGEVVIDINNLDTDVQELLAKKDTNKIIKEIALSVHKKEKIINRFLKRFLDIIGGLFGVLALIPLTCIIYIANKIEKDNGSIFYVQERIGKNGKKFKMYKYRSMVMGADEKLNKYLEENEEAREEYRINKKLKHDPRVTKVGDFIRRTSIDEFPQFINILKGEMSLVGPRPYLPREQEEMREFYTYITSLKPGLTGYWQVNGRSDVTFEDRLFMDMRYYNQCDLKVDVKLLAKTVAKVVMKEGAA